MTTYDYRTGADATTSGGPGGTDSTSEQAKQAATTAAEEGRHLAGTAKEEALDVAADAKQQGAQFLHQAQQELEQQGRTQLDTLVTTLQGFAEDLEKMARGEGAGSGLARDVVHEVGDKARAVSSQLRDREPGELIDQARHYARRKPGTFLLGALAAGVVAGRLARGARDASSSTGSSPATPTGAGPEADSTRTAAFPPAPGTQGLTGSAPQAGTATGQPLAGSSAPPVPPPVPQAAPQSAPPAYPDGTRSSATEWGTP